MTSPGEVVEGVDDVMEDWMLLRIAAAAGEEEVMQLAACLITDGGEGGVMGLGPVSSANRRPAGILR